MCFACLVPFSGIDGMMGVLSLWMVNMLICRSGEKGVETEVTKVITELLEDDRQA